MKQYIKYKGRLHRLYAIKSSQKIAFRTGHMARKKTGRRYLIKEGYSETMGRKYGVYLEV